MSHYLVISIGSFMIGFICKETIIKDKVKIIEEEFEKGKKDFRRMKQLYLTMEEDYRELNNKYVELKEEYLNFKEIKEEDKKESNSWLNILEGMN